MTSALVGQRAPAFVRFMSQVDGGAVTNLLTTCDNLVKDGVGAIHLLLSTPGGSVFHGISAYNYLRGLPVDLVTHNFGSVDSIGVVLFCAGKVRKSVPNARFMIHGVQANLAGPTGMQEDQLQEILKSVQIDTLNIGRIVAQHTRKSVEEVHSAMRARTTLDPQQAVDFGLVDKIEALELPPGAEVFTIQSQPTTGRGSPMLTMQPVQLRIGPAGPVPVG